MIVSAPGKSKSKRVPRIRAGHDYVYRPYRSQCVPYTCTGSGLKMEAVLVFVVSEFVYMYTCTCN